MVGQGRLLQLLCLIGLSAAVEARGQKVLERFSFGGFASTERFKNESGGSDSNDFAILSARQYLRVQDWGAGRWEFISDLRDKHDFFDKLDAERLKLTDKNQFQLRQLSVRRPNPAGFWSPQVGRFAVPEAGAVFVDGGQVANHWSSALATSIFGGWNPKQDSQSYLEFNSHAVVYGANATYMDHSGGWQRNFYLSHALVEKAWDGHVDRRFLFHNMNYQWRRDSRLISLMYLDFVPRTYVQTADLIWQQAFTAKFATEVEGLTIDAIEYSRRQGVLETLPSSAYSQASLQLIYRPDIRGRTFVKALSGRRAVDRTTKTEVDIGWTRSGVFSPKWDASLLAGSRRNFASNDQLVRGGIGYFSRKWEWNLDLDFATQKYDDGKTLNPIVVETSLSHYHSRKLYSTFSLQRAWDEEKTIVSAFFKIGYQTGNQEVSPIRDGAPPRGAL